MAAWIEDDVFWLLFAFVAELAIFWRRNFRGKRLDELAFVDMGCSADFEDKPGGDFLLLRDFQPASIGRLQILKIPFSLPEGNFRMKPTQSTISKKTNITGAFPSHCHFLFFTPSKSKLIVTIHHLESDLVTLKKHVKKIAPHLDHHILVISEHHIQNEV